jgi:hypothetical protein
MLLSLTPRTTKPNQPRRYLHLSALSFALSLDQQLCLIILGGNEFDPKGAGIPLKALSFGALWLRSTKTSVAP